MPELILDISMSLDGFVAGPNPSLEDPLGQGGMRLHEWIIATKAWREAHGQEGGEEGVDSDLAAELVGQASATIMGRRMFSGGVGPWEDDPNADAWWGDDPPFHHPVFVLTHHERELLPLTASSQLWSRPRPLRAMATSGWPAVPMWSASTCVRDWSTGSSYTSPPCCSARARGFSRAMRERWSSPASANRPAAWCTWTTGGASGGARAQPPARPARESSSRCGAPRARAPGRRRRCRAGVSSR